jgi:hypothetical protein
MVVIIITSAYANWILAMAQIMGRDLFAKSHTQL